MVESNAIPGFLPSTHGLRFANRFPPGPTLRLGPIDPRWIGIGDASAGLCGGMSWYVRERFEAERRSTEVETRVRRDFESGIRAGVTGTPALFRGGQMVALGDLELLATSD